MKARIHGGEWQDVSTYAFKVDRVANAKHNVEITSVTKFEFEGKVEIQVKSIAQDIKSYKIRPNSYGIKAIQEGNTLTFSPDCLSPVFVAARSSPLQESPVETEYF